MSHHLHLVRCIPGYVEITEDPHAVVTDPLPRRVSSRSDQFAHQLAQADLIASRWAARNPNYLTHGVHK